MIFFSQVAIHVYNLYCNFHEAFLCILFTIADVSVYNDWLLYIIYPIQKKIINK